MKVVRILPEGDPAVTPRVAPDLHQSEQDFSVVIIGCGCPQTVLGRSFPSAMIQCKGKYFLVDVGDGTVRRLAEGGFPCKDVESVLFTHFHADHDAGYPYFLINSWMNGRQRLNLVGPPKTKAYHEMLIAHYEDDLRYRTSAKPEKMQAMLNTTIREIEDKDTFEIDGVKISTAKMIHTAHTIGYRFEFDGKVIVISGDTGYTPAVGELAKDADILVIDAGPLPDTGFICASLPTPAGEPPAPRSGPRSQVDAKMQSPHPRPGEVSRMATEAGAKTIVLTHYIPTMVDEVAAEAQIREHGYTGNIVFGRDLMEILP